MKSPKIHPEGQVELQMQNQNPPQAPVKQENSYRASERRPQRVNDPLFSVEGRTAIVTGASSGLGNRFATVLANRGAYVIAAARRRDRLTDLRNQFPDHLLAVECDVTSEDDVRGLVDQATAWRGPIDLLINNAGTTSVQPAEQEDADTFARVVDVNLIALYRASHHVGRHMIDNGGGTIVNVASINALVASWSIPEASYCASKGAVVSLTRELAAQWADRGIRVNALAPGYFRTELTEDLFSSPAGERRFRRMPMKRAGRPEELDGALLFLSSNASSYMTGQTLVIDGGWTSV